MSLYAIYDFVNKFYCVYHTRAAMKKIAQIADTVSRIKVMQVCKFPRKNITTFAKNRMVLLGPVYIKLGQFIASRPDIFGKDIASVLSTLQNQVPPMAIIDRAAIANVFDSFDEVPIASASIAQLHTAVYKNKRVAVKIKRQNIEDEIKRELDYVIECVLWCDRFFRWRTITSDDVIKQTYTSMIKIRNGLLKECDFYNEVQNLKRFRNLYHMEESIIIPKVYESLSTPDMIVMEYIPSQPIAGGALLCESLMAFFMRQLLFTGYVHGDPHAGNLGLIKKGTMVVYDFGNVIEISFTERQLLKELFCMLMVDNRKQVLYILKELGATVTDAQGLLLVLGVYRKYLQTIDINDLAMFKDPKFGQSVVLPDKLLALVRVFGTLEGICKEMDPEFNYFQMIGSFLDDAFFDDDYLIYKSKKDIANLMSGEFF